MKVSIITPSFNQATFLRETGESVLSQRGDFDLEWIVIDGGSTDGTQKLLDSIRDPRLIWISERDAGQGAAINKGMAMAEGDIVAWLNSDDLYVPGALEAVVRAFNAAGASQWLVGRYEVIDSSGAVFRSSIVRYKERAMRRYAYHKLLRENFIPQPAVFWRREFGLGVGPLDETLHWTMDYDLWLRMGRRYRPLFLDQVLAKFRLHEESKSGKVDRRQFDEQFLVASRYFRGDRLSRWVHRLNVEKIVWAYRIMRMLGR